MKRNEDFPRKSGVGLPNGFKVVAFCGAMQVPIVQIVQDYFTTTTTTVSVCVRGVSMAGYFRRFMARHQDHPTRREKRIKNQISAQNAGHTSIIDRQTRSIADRSITIQKQIIKKRRESVPTTTFAFNVY